MLTKTTWKEKFDILIAFSFLSIKQIQIVFDVGQPRALEIRSKTIELAKENGRYISERKVPTDLVLQVMGLDYSFFRKMVFLEKSTEKGAYTV